MISSCKPHEYSFAPEVLNDIGATAILSCMMAVNNMQSLSRERTKVTTRECYGSTDGNRMILSH